MKFSKSKIVFIKLASKLSEKLKLTITKSLISYIEERILN